jgi:PAS domain S-box-containing protein
MLDKVKGLLAPPTFEDDEDKTRVAGLLHIMLLSVMVLGVVLAPVGLLLEGSYPGVIAIFGTMPALALLLWFWARRGHIVSTSVVLALLLFFAAAAAVCVVGSIRAPVASAFFVAVVVAGVLIGHRGTIAFTVLSLVVLLVLWWAESTGLLVPYVQERAGFAAWLTLAGSLLSVAVLLALSTRGLDQALGRARRSERALTMANRELTSEIAERTRVTEALRDSEERLRNIFENADQIIYTLSPDGTLSFVSPAWTRKLGHEVGEIQGQHFAPFVHPDDVPACVAFLDRVMSTGQPQRGIEYRVRHKDGTWRWHTSVGAAVKDEQGQPLYYMGLDQDISERKRAERERETLQRLALELTAPLTLKELVQRLAGHCRQLFAYDSFRFDLYDERKQLRVPVYAEDTPAGGQEPVDIETESEAKRPQIIRALFAGEPVLVHREEGPVTDGLVPWGFAGRRSLTMMFAPVRWQGRCIGVVYAHSYTAARYNDRDLALLQMVADQCGAALARVQADEALRESEQRYRALFERTNDAVFIFDLDGMLLTANQQAAELLGYTADELVGMPVTQMISLQEVADNQNKLAAVIAGEPLPLYERFFRRKDGSEFPAEVNVALVHDPQGKPLHIHSVVRDITERKQIEREIRQLNAELERRVVERTAQLEAANQELEAFAYSVSHDLRAPLRAMDSFSRIVLEDFGPQLPPEAQRYLGMVRDNARRMRALIQDLLTFSRLGRQELRKQTISPRELVRQVLEELRIEQDEHPVEITVGDLPPCQADPALLKQVYANLLSNALKFTRGQGGACIEVGCLQEGQGTVYYVRDNGVGFDMRYADKLFGVFQRLHGDQEYEGTGVGLAIVQRIIHRHGGRVWAKAEVGQGATFYFTLPDASPAPGAFEAITR